ncbi:MAG: insulinase family protein, partial [Chitinophagales bacterium]
MQKYIWIFILSFSVLSCSQKSTTQKTEQSQNVVEDVAQDVEAAQDAVDITEEIPNEIQEALKMPIPLDPSVRYGTLPNGMKYYIKQNKKPENRVEMRLAVNAGSNQEDENQLGLAHFVEHMAFNGSKNFAKNDLVNFLEGAGVKFGAHLNAYTSFDETVYMLQLPTDKADVLDKGLLVFEDWASGLSFDPTEIDKERGVVVSEWRTGQGPDMRMTYKFLPVAYKDSRYAKRLPIGDTAILKNAPYNVFTKFYKDWYRPDLMAMCIVGDINVDSMEQEVIKRFSPIKNPTNERPKVEYELPEHKETLVSINTDAEATGQRVYIMYKHPKTEINTLQGYGSYVANQLFNTMYSQRLAEITQKPDAPFAYASGSYDEETRKNDAFNAFAIVKKGQIKEAISVLLTENERIKQHGFTQSELDRAKIDLLKSLEDALKEKDKTESRSLVMEYVYNYLKGIPAPGIDVEYQLANAIVPQLPLEIFQEMAKEYISDENAVIIVTAPESEKANIPSEAAILALDKSIKASKIDAYVDVVSNEPLMENIPTAGKVVKTEKNDKYNITTWTLSNGAKVVVKPTDFKNDEILFGAYSPGGTSQYSDDDFMSADYSNLIISESGISNFDAITLNKMLIGKTVEVGPFVGELSDGFEGSTTPKDVETMLQLVNLYFTAPRKSKDDFNTLMQKQHAMYDNLLENPQYYFLNEYYNTIYKNSIRRSLPTKEALDKVDFEKAFKFYGERFSNAADFTFYFVGNIDVNTLQPLVETYLGSIPSSDKKETWKNPNII